MTKTAEQKKHVEIAWAVKVTNCWGEDRLAYSRNLEEFRCSFLRAASARKRIKEWGPSMNHMKPRAIRVEIREL